MVWLRGCYRVSSSCAGCRSGVTLIKGSLVTVAHSPGPTWEPVVGAGDLPADHDNSPY